MLTKGAKERRLTMSLETPIKIREFQRKLYTKAKQEPSYRFYCLYDKICREDILTHSYELAKANGGAPAVDNQSFDGIEAARPQARARRTNSVTSRLRRLQIIAAATSRVRLRYDSTVLPN
jgi:hypothetical protein